MKLLDAHASFIELDGQVILLVALGRSSSAAILAASTRLAPAPPKPTQVGT